MKHTNLKHAMLRALGAINQSMRTAAAGGRRWFGLALVAGAAASVAFTLAQAVGGQPLASAVFAGRERVAQTVALRAAGSASLETSHFIIHYAPGDGTQATLVAEEGERVLGRVAADLQMPVPDDKIQVILEPTGEKMTRDLHLTGEAPVGAYYEGVLWVLAPEAWVSEPGASGDAQFRQRGPMAHELTHLLLDRRAKGNFPAWFTEGVAQYEDERITGYVWPLADLRQRYTYDQLEHEFDTLPNQALAYRQALALVSRLAQQGVLNGLIDRLAQGVPFDQALQEKLGTQYRAFVEMHGITLGG